MPLRRILSKTEGASTKYTIAHATHKIKQEAGILTYCFKVYYRSSRSATALINAVLSKVVHGLLFHENYIIKLQKIDRTDE